MKKFVLFIVVLSVCLFSSCASPQTEYVYINEDFGDGEAYYEGFDDGYSEGYDEGYLKGYDWGYGDGYNEVQDVIYDATDYARKKTGWSVYEAWSNVSMYRTGVDPYGYGLPTKEEYLQSVDTLVLFCEYLDNAGFGG